MSEPNKDKKLESNTKGKEKEAATDSDFDDTSDSNDSSKRRSAEPKVFDNAMDFFSHKMTQGVAIKEPVAGKRKRAEGGLKRQITLKSELHVIGMRFDDSDSEPSKVDAVAKGKGKVKEKITDDVSSGSDTDSDEACKRMKPGSKEDADDGSDDNDGDGAGSGAGAHAGLPVQGVQVAGN